MVTLVHRVGGGGMVETLILFFNRLEGGAERHASVEKRALGATPSEPNPLSVFHLVPAAAGRQNLAQGN